MTATPRAPSSAAPVAFAIDPDARAAAIDELALLLRPPGMGVFAVSTGRAAMLRDASRYLGLEGDVSDTAALEAAFLAQLRAIDAPDQARAPLMLAIPSDNGAGIVRGAMHGPRAIRAALGHAPILDVGDVMAVPQLLDDEMCSAPLRARVAAALYPRCDEATRARLPVAPISIARRAIEIVRTLAPARPVFALGGDHTITWPVIEALMDADPARNGDVGILHFDAHTDLLPERLGVRYCFATWAYHANRRIGAGQRLLQIGIRASGHDRAHWEQTTDVRQIWGDEARAMAPRELAARAVEHLLSRGVRRLYLSNDIDGTDARWAAACGTPEPGGLTPDHVLAVIDALSGHFLPLGADLVEVAPDLSLSAEASATTVRTAVDYTHATLRWLSRGMG